MTRRERSTGPALSVRISDAFLEALGGADSQITDLARRRPPGLTPERRLLLAVLTAAVEDVRNDTCGRVGDHCPRRHAGYLCGVCHRRQEALAWFLTREPSEWPYAFERICDVFGWDADAIRLRARLGFPGPQVPPRTARKSELACNGMGGEVVR